MGARPSAFLSVSMSAVKKDEQHRADTQKCIDEFLEETGWKPTVTKAVAGALKYTKYDWLKRFVMVQIVKSEGGDIDTSKDHEYTDWADLKAFVSEFLKLVA
jgi:menaquinone-dependent protoporphyrinogen oxidase